MVRRDLESKLKGRVSEDLTLLQSMSQQQEQMLDSRLAAVREQQEQTRELVEGGLATFMATKGAKGTKFSFTLCSVKISIATYVHTCLLSIYI